MRIITYLLLSYFTLGALIPQGDFSQLLKLNDLMEHYDLHQKEAILLGEDISFSAFLYLHFIDGEEHEHEDENDHDNLPFQNITSPIVLCPASSPMLTAFVNDIAEANLPTYNSVFQAGITFDIFQPPIFA